MSGLLSYQERQVGSNGKKRCVCRIQKKSKRLKKLGSENRKFILSRNITSDEASMVKPTDFQYVKSQMTDMILQQVESDVTSPSLERSVSFEITPSVT